MKMRKQNVLRGKSKNAYVGADSISAQCNKDINNMPVGAGLVSAPNHRGITLIALVITIILLLILAGVTLNLTIGEGGLIKFAKQAEKDYNHSQKNEIDDLDKLYSSIKISGDSQITLTKEELDTYIKNKMVGNSVGNSSVDSYSVDKFSLNNNEKSMLSGNSKFGTINTEGELVFDDPGLYYISSSFTFDGTPKQLYNRIQVNGEEMIYSVPYASEAASPATITFYANKGDKIKIYLKAYGGVSNIFTWKR